jgi:protein TonB
MTASPQRNTLHYRYYLYLEVGTILALLTLIAAFRADWSPDQEFQVNLDQQEVVEMEEVQQTEQETEPPPPPRPPAPIEAPNNAVIEQQNLDFDASLDLSEEMDVRREPPPPETSDEQKEEDESEEIFVAVEESPDCGGIQAVQKEVTYPDFARKAGIEGRVIVQFVVDEEGDVTRSKVTRDVHTLLDKEALRAIQELECTPGRQRGTPVKVRMSMPVVFRLKDGPR